MLDLEGTPYELDLSAKEEITKQIKSLEDRVSVLRGNGSLNDETIRSYYGEKRFEQVAESNAIEGNTLSAGETEVAVLKGITITGHDPAYIRDAISLDQALQRLAEMAKNKKTVTDIEQLHSLHGLILGERPGAGVFRDRPVRIRGSEHVPPKSWSEVMDQMKDWENWSKKNHDLATPIRAAILHAWLVHIHPFIDGNGRSARAITNLELIRAGYPPVIFRKKERERYIEALAESDFAGDLRSFFELTLERLEGALAGLEISAKKKQDYSYHVEKIRQRQEQHLNILETSVYLLISTLEHYLGELLPSGVGSVHIKSFEHSLDLEDYLSLCEKSSISKSWSFIVNITIPGLPKLEKLAYFGYRSPMMFHHLNDVGGPSLYWSSKNPSGYPKWISNDEDAPEYVEMTTKQGVGDAWHVRKNDNAIKEIGITTLAKSLAKALIELAYKS